MDYASMPEKPPTLQHAEPREDIPLPAPHLTVPDAPEKQFPIRHSDWLQLRRKIEGLSDRLPNLANLQGASVGIAVSAGIAYFPWLAADSQLSTKAQQHYAYITPMLAILTIAGIILALLFFFMNRNMSKMKRISVESVLADMDAIYEPYKKAKNRKGTLWLSRKPHNGEGDKATFMHLSQPDRLTSNLHRPNLTFWPASTTFIDLQ